MHYDEFVVIFAINSTRGVLLIRKGPLSRRAWMIGKLNGLGGCIEERDKTPTDAAVRKLFEECGVAVNGHRLVKTAFVGGLDMSWCLHVFGVAFTDYEAALADSFVSSVEPVMWIPLLNVVLGERKDLICDVAEYVKKTCIELGPEAWSRDYTSG